MYLFSSKTVLVEQAYARLYDCLRIEDKIKRNQMVFGFFVVNYNLFTKVEIAKQYLEHFNFTVRCFIVSILYSYKPVIYVTEIALEIEQLLMDICS